MGPAPDIHAVGAVLYRALAGEPPFTGEHLVTVLRKIIGHAPVPLRRRDPSIPRDLEAITLLCLKKSPSQRYASAGALAEDLLRHLAGQPVDALGARKAAPIRPNSRLRAPAGRTLTFLIYQSGVGGSNLGGG